METSWAARRVLIQLFSLIHYRWTQRNSEQKTQMSLQVRMVNQWNNYWGNTAGKYHSGFWMLHIHRKLRFNVKLTTLPEGICSGILIPTLHRKSWSHSLFWLEALLSQKSLSAKEIPCFICIFRYICHILDQKISYPLHSIPAHLCEVIPS